MINIVVGYNMETETFFFIDHKKADMTEEFFKYIENEDVINDYELLEHLLHEGLESFCHIYYIPLKGNYKKTPKLDEIPKEIFRYVHEHYNKNVKESFVERNDKESIVYLNYKRKRNK